MGELELGVIGIKAFRALQVICALGGIILVHEFGHYIAAKWSRMKVEEFAIGIGPTIRRWERGGTIYKLSPLLFMGYVKIAGLEGADDPEAGEGNFYARPHHQRIVTIVAGALVNMLFAGALFCLLYGLWGVPDIRVSVGDVADGQPAAAAGVPAGWRIEAIDGERVMQPDDVTRAVRGSDGGPVRLTLSQAAERREFTVQPALHREAGEAEPSWRIGISLEDDDALTPRVARVEPGGAAAEAGLRRGDVIVAVAGEPTDSAPEILAALVTVPEELEQREPEDVVLDLVPLTVRRGDETLEVSVQPRPVKQHRLADPPPGVEVDEVDLELEEYLVGDPGLVLERRYLRLSPAAALTAGAKTGLDALRTVLESLGFLVQGRGLDKVGGPVMIVKSLSSQAFLGGYALLEWAGILSIMIGVFNLLPLPGLDGGRLVFLLAEWVLGRPPLRFAVRRRPGFPPVKLDRDESFEHARAREAMVHSIGILMLLGLIVLVSIRDYLRYLA